MKLIIIKTNLPGKCKADVRSIRNMIDKTTPPILFY